MAKSPLGVAGPPPELSARASFLPGWVASSTSSTRNLTVQHGPYLNDHLAHHSVATIEAAIPIDVRHRRAPRAAAAGAGQPGAPALTERGLTASSWAFPRRARHHSPLTHGRLQTEEGHDQRHAEWPSRAAATSMTCMSLACLEMETWLGLIVALVPRGRTPEPSVPALDLRLSLAAACVASHDSAEGGPRVAYIDSGQEEFAIARARRGLAMQRRLLLAFAKRATARATKHSHKAVRERTRLSCSRWSSLDGFSLAHRAEECADADQPAPRRLCHFSGSGATPS